MVLALALWVLSSLSAVRPGLSPLLVLPTALLGGLARTGHDLSSRTTVSQARWGTAANPGVSVAEA